MAIRILLADDHAVIRTSLKLLLEREEDLRVVAETGNGFDAIRLVKSGEIDLLVLDLAMPGLPGVKVAETILEERPEFPIVVLTMHEDDYHLRELLKIGVRGFVLKKSTGPDLLQAIRAVCRGEQFVDMHLAGKLIDFFVGRPQKQKGQVESLSQREKEVLSLLAFGYTNREISDELCISERTVESHRSALMTKLELRSRADLVRFAIENGLFGLE